MKKKEAASLAERLGYKLRKLRKASGLTQEALAEYLDVTVSYVGQLERGERHPSLDTIEKISKSLNLPVHDLLNDDESSPQDVWIKRYATLLRKCTPRQLAAMYDMIQAFLQKN